jgi:hypothetical protein
MGHATRTAAARAPRPRETAAPANAQAAVEPYRIVRRRAVNQFAGGGCT